MADALEWPMALWPKDATFHPDIPSKSGGLSTNGFEQVTVSPAGRWRARISVSAISEETVLAWRALIASMMGRVGTILVPKWELFGPADRNGRRFNSNSATPYDDHVSNWDLTGFGQAQELVAVLANEVGRGSTQIVVSLNKIEGPRPGQYFGIGRRLHLVQSAYQEEEGGLTTLRFWPPLRVAAPAFTPVILDKPVCLMRFAQDSTGELFLERGLHGEGTFELVEASPNSTEVNPAIPGGALFLKS